jgi:hypothetical protein
MILPALFSSANILHISTRLIDNPAVSQGDWTSLGYAGVCPHPAFGHPLRGERGKSSPLSPRERAGVRERREDAGRRGNASGFGPIRLGHHR